VVSVDAIQEREELAGMRQVNIRSIRYGIAGKPDRVFHTSRGPVPVDVKKCFCPRNGRPYDGHVAQLAVYCLLLEDKIPVLCSRRRHRLYRSIGDCTFRRAAPDLDLKHHPRGSGSEAEPRDPYPQPQSPRQVRLVRFSAGMSSSARLVSQGRIRIFILTGYFCERSLTQIGYLLLFSRLPMTQASRFTPMGL
jgi:hypothetical protein